MTTTSPPEPLMTPEQACEYLQLFRGEDKRPNINRLYLLRSRHGLPAYRMGGQLRFRQSEIDLWLKVNSLPAPNPGVPAP